MKVVYNEKSQQLMQVGDLVTYSDILKFGQEYVVTQAGYFYNFEVLYNNTKTNIVCAKSHFLTESQIRKLKLEKINNV